VSELTSLASYLEYHVERAGSILVRQLKRRDALRRQQDAHSDVITGQLHKREYQNQYLPHPGRPSLLLPAFRPFRAARAGEGRAPAASRVLFADPTHI
jgi:hypothetical protein